MTKSKGSPGSSSGRRNGQASDNGKKKWTSQADNSFSQFVLKTILKNGPQWQAAKKGRAGDKCHNGETNVETRRKKE